MSPYRSVEKQKQPAKKRLSWGVFHWLRCRVLLRTLAGHAWFRDFGTLRRVWVKCSECNATITRVFKYEDEER